MSGAEGHFRNVRIRGRPEREVAAFQENPHDDSRSEHGAGQEPGVGVGGGSGRCLSRLPRAGGAGRPRAPLMRNGRCVGQRPERRKVGEAAGPLVVARTWLWGSEAILFYLPGGSTRSLKIHHSFSSR